MSWPQFVGDFSTGDLSQWDEIHNQGSGTLADATVVSSPLRSGSFRAGKFTCNSGQSRCEVNIPQARFDQVTRTGSDRYYGWSVYYPTGFPSGAWQVTGQWHNPFDATDTAWSDSSPPLSVIARSTDRSTASAWAITGGGGATPGIPAWTISLGTLSFDTWLDLVIRMKGETTAANCLLQVWVNGTKVIDQVPPQPLIYAMTNTNNRYNYLKIGYYRDPAITTTASVYYCNVRQGGTYASVDPSLPRPIDPLRG